MTITETSDNCPCGSGKSFTMCCEPLLIGREQAESAEQLMRSRYTAYVYADIDYIERTTLPAMRPRYDFDGLKQWAEQSEWLGLEIHNQSRNTDKDAARVQFTARYRQDDGITHHSEDSEFIVENNTWFFVHGKDYTPPPRQQPGRNDPCTCGSGKKFKKCCLR